MADRRDLQAQPRADPAAAEQSPKFRRLDLSAVPNWSRNVVEPRFTIPYQGNMGKSTVRGADAIKAAAKDRGLSSPAPPALEIHEDPVDATVLYGIPVMEKEPGDLTLDWMEQQRQVKANFQAILRSRRIRIPRGTKMVINLEHVDNEELGHCVKLSWTGDCFAPIQELEELDEEQSNA